MTDQLPEYGPGPDLRANAFVGAWDRIEAAQKLKLDHRKKLVDPLPEIYWATMLEADVLARLATADEDPGRDAGRYVLDREQRAIKRRTRAKSAFEEKLRKPPRVAGEPKSDMLSETDPPAKLHPDDEPAVGQRVRVKRGDWVGRTGKVTEVRCAYGEPPIADVALDLEEFSDTPVDTSIPTADLESVER
ncbi:hypothetical protein MKUB_32860 [Mycobacterium kubicae]|uniref:KOW domain-containing protein n=1 Tax=Mycobacterium kubicae TaxID=120959 RepID=A0AAX1JBI6_9MYCO|nr:hypothetical protein [Mycobacterium kubicae]MCV7095290.1 hypothetical protein [Mycobacterium kubicae]QPI37882.1 hypothetical protein I2456_27190 [Mycobacterium kubicae]GFG65796.1 hypothetical protein MKUB_32860 [Mycobacterium kubicae]